jgi:ESS family glutamate:Na+ symporter
MIALLIGTLLNQRSELLSRYNIPDPVTGGLLFAAVAAVLAALRFKVTTDQTLRPLLLQMFFAGVGMCANLRLLRHGGKALVTFLLVVFPYMAAQDLLGLAMARLLDLHPLFGLVGGTVTLVGGHGTGAAYAERFAEVHNLQSVMELTMTVATIGLVLGGIVAGPVAQYLLTRHGLRSQADGATGFGHQMVPATGGITTVAVVGGLAGILAAVLAGQWLAAWTSGWRITIPSFLWCMLLGVAIRNLAPLVRIRFDDKASDLISGVCLSLFLVVTMMALDLIQVAVSAGPLILIVAAQTVLMIVYALFVCFRLMGRDYEAAVTCAAFVGFSMGSAATAMANMRAVTTKHGPAPQAALIVPLAGAFFMDLMNALLLAFMLALPFVGG